MIRSFEEALLDVIDKGANSIAAAEELCLVPGQYNLIRTSTASSRPFFYYYGLMGQGIFAE